MAREFVDSPELIKELAEGEKIVWRGMPENFPLMEADVSKGLTRRWIICIVAAVAVAAAYIVLTAGKGVAVSLWLLILALAVVAYFAALPSMDRGNVLNKCRYYITDRRVILHYADREIFSLPLAGLRSEIIDAANGCVHVELGASVGIKAGKRRAAAFVPKKDDNDNVCGLVLYNVADSDSIKKIFS